MEEHDTLSEEARAILSQFHLSSSLARDDSDSDDDDDEEDKPVVFTLRNHKQLKIMTAEMDHGDAPLTLFAFNVWNGAIRLAEYLDQYPEIVQGKTVLELGAGAALPSVVALHHSAAKVVITDYPSLDLIENIKRNIKLNFPDMALQSKAIGDDDRHATTSVSKSNSSSPSPLPSIPFSYISNDHSLEIMGFYWGSDPTPLIAASRKRTNITSSEGEEEGFDVILMAELLWKHEQHEILLKSATQVLKKKGGQILVSFCHHVAGCEEKDLNFFTLATEVYGLFVEQLETVSKQHLFGAERRMVSVFLYRLYYK